MALVFGLLALSALTACGSDGLATVTPVPPAAVDATATPRPVPTQPAATTDATAPPAVLTDSPQQVPAPVNTGQPALPQPEQTGEVVTGTPITTPQGASDEPPRITDQQLLALMQKGQVLVIDVRDPALYKEKHITGSISFPFSDLDAHYGDLPRDRLVVAYCQ